MTAATPSDREAELQEVIAQSIYASQVADAREVASKADLQIDRLKRVFSKVRGETDRSAAILLFALAEDLMLHSLKANLNTELPGGWKDVTEGNGLLATANNRITFLELLDWIRPTTASDLRRMKSIRNRFAHYADVESFADEKIPGYIGGMQPIEKICYDKWPKEIRETWRKITIREIYLVRAVHTVTALVNDLAVGPVSRKMQVDPADVFGTSYEEFPEQIKQVSDMLEDFLNSTHPPP